MSSTLTRRMKRQMDRDIKKGIVKKRDVESDYIPTTEEVEEYVLNKSKELRMNEFVIKPVTPITYGM